MIEHDFWGGGITPNWRGCPFVSQEIIIQLIASTTPQTWLRIQAELDTGLYPTGVVVSDDELNTVNIRCSEFHGEWNYEIMPKRRKK